MTKAEVSDHLVSTGLEFRMCGCDNADCNGFKAKVGDVWVVPVIHSDQKEPLS